jgi:hypothetical protein
MRPVTEPAGASAADVRASGSERAARVITQPAGTSGGRPATVGWRQARQALGLSLREVEERTRINRGELSRIERGFGPRIDHARRLLALYDSEGGS